MKTWHKHVLASVVATVGVTGVLAASIALTPSQLGPADLYPDPSLSPGLVSQTAGYSELTAISSCGTYSACHRKTTEAMKRQVQQEYATSTCGEIDHVLPLALGGLDDVRNLWCQPTHNTWNGVDYGYKTKDRVEDYMVLQMKAQKIPLKEAQDCFLVDWVACYNKYILRQPSLDSGDKVDPDS